MRIGIIRRGERRKRRARREREEEGGRRQFVGEHMKGEMEG